MAGPTATTGVTTTTTSFQPVASAWMPADPGTFTYPVAEAGSMTFTIAGDEVTVRVEGIRAGSIASAQTVNSWSATYGGHCQGAPVEI